MFLMEKNSVVFTLSFDVKKIGVDVLEVEDDS